MSTTPTSKQLGLAAILYMQACAAETKIGYVPVPFDDQTPMIRDVFIAKAIDLIRQVEGHEDADRDEETMRKIITDAASKLSSSSMIGRSEIAFMTEVSMECSKTLSFDVIRKYLSADRMMFMYYSNLSVAQAVQMFHSFVVNMADKVAQTKVKRGYKDE